MKMKKILTIALVASMATASVYADAVSINWKEFAGGVNDVADGYGVEAANNWNNSHQGSAWNDALLSSGAASTIDVSVSNPGGWETAGGSALNGSAMRGGIGIYAAGGSVTLSQINGTFETYDVIVYVGGFNAAGNAGSVTDGTSTYYYSPLNPYSTSLIQSTDTDGATGGYDSGTYVRFNGLTADSTTISMSQVQGGMILGGIQVVGTVIPEPATLGLIGAFGGGLLFIRRRFMI
jgi:hypothetical protein